LKTPQQELVAAVKAGVEYRAAPVNQFRHSNVRNRVVLRWGNALSVLKSAGLRLRVFAHASAT
jgi:hypothetical protein